MAKTKKSQKKTQPRKFAPIGLWIGGVALLATGILLVVKLLSSANIYTIPNEKAFNLALWICAGFIVIGPGLFVLLDPRRASQIYKGRQARYGSNAALLSIAFIGIVVVANILAFKYPGNPKDFTQDKQHTLASETLDALKALPNPVHAIGFFTSKYSPDTAQKLLENYANNSGGKFTFEFIDPDQNPLAAQTAGVSGDGKIFLQMEDRHEIVSYASEKDLTSALIRLMNPGDRTVYFLTGHGEHDIETSGDASYTSVKTALEAKNYTVKTLNLLAENQIPSDAKAVVIGGYQDPFTEGEISLLKDYIARGGALVIMVEPLPLTNIGTDPDLLSTYLSTYWGITPDNDIVIDTNSGTQPLYAVAASYGDHDITKKLQGRVSFFPAARSLTIDSSGAEKPVALVQTVSNAWGETDFAAIESSGNVFNDAGVDFAGPLTLAAAAEDAATKSRIVVFGDSDFAADMFFSQYANGDMILNAIDWAAGEEKMINLTTPEQISRTLNPPSGTTMLVLWLTFLCLLPGLVVAGGVASWLVRRSRG